MNPKDLPAFRALMKDGYYRVMDRCIGLDCCGGVCASFDALAAATPEQLLGIIGEGRGVTPSRAEVTDAIAKLKYELGCDPVDYGGVGEAFRVLEESLDAGRKDRELLAGVQRVEMDMREDGERVCWDGVAGTFCFSDGTCHAESIAAMGLDIMRRDP